MDILKNSNDLENFIQHHKAADKTVGLVPTMGALHTGHLSLVDIMQQHADIGLVSIFVNPKQFAPHEDFDQYPRTLDKDIAKLSTTNIHAVYAPSIDDIYPNHDTPTINTGALGQILEGKARPHFFDGVATVVYQLLSQTKADIAVFGEKDYQQLCIIRHMVQTYNLPTRIFAGAIIRENNGLAMSSRNRYLDPSQQQLASELYNTLCHIKSRIQTGHDIDVSIQQGKEHLCQIGFDKVDYISLCDAVMLTPCMKHNKPARLLAAAFVNQVRLLDNIDV